MCWCWCGGGGVVSLFGVNKIIKRRNTLESNVRAAHSTSVAKSNKCFVRFGFFFSFSVFVFIDTSFDHSIYLCRGRRNAITEREKKTENRIRARARARHPQPASNWTAEACGHLNGNGIGKTKKSRTFDEIRFQVAREVAQ